MIISRDQFIIFLSLTMNQNSSYRPAEIAQNVLQLKTYNEMAGRLQELLNKSQATFREVMEELKLLLVIHQERIYTHHNNLTADKLKIIRDIFKFQSNVDQKYFEVHSGYLLLAVTEGYLLQNLPYEKISKMKQIFARKIQKNSALWGFEELQNMQAYLMDRSTGYLPNPSPLHHDRELDRFSYFFTFYQNFGLMFPQMTDIYSIYFKMMLCLREQLEKDRQIMHILKQKYFSSRFHQQTTIKNMKFVLQFFKHSFSQKQCRYYPQKSFQSILSYYSIEEIEKMLTITSIGVIWDQAEVYEYFLNCIKLGFTEVSRKMMIAMIKFGQKSGKLTQLSYCYENNIKRIFIFMKYPKFYLTCLQILKYFIYSPPPTQSLFQKFWPDALALFGKLPPQHKYSFLNVLQVVAFAYKDTTPVDELNKFILQNVENNEIGKLSQEQIQKVLKEYCWKDKMNNKNLSINQAVVDKPKSKYKGLYNIGNSCYMNSFLQSLFMNREFLRYIITSSTKQIKEEKEKDKKFEGRQKQFIRKQIQACVKPFAQLQKTFALLLKSIRNHVSPANIRQVAPTMFRNSYQHDTIEFGREYLDLIFKNNIPAMFEGEVTTQILCKECSEVRQRKEAFLDYHVAAEQGQLQQLVKSSFDEEVVKDLTCDHCEKRGQESIKRHCISKFPNYLIISVNRFEYDVIQKRNKKNKAKIAINPVLTINQTSYQVYSIIIHTGPSPNAGHYFSFSKTSYQNNSKWVCHNDAEVSQFQSYSQVTNFLDNSPQDTPYILFYQNIEYVQNNKQKLSQPIQLRQPQQNFVRKDNDLYLSSQKKTQLKLLQQPLINFASFMKDDDDDHNGPGSGGFYNSYVA